MIITRTPFRISFFGGGTDFPDWYKLNGGAVLATTIDKYCYISVRYLPPFFDHKFRVVYSKTELCGSVNEILHPGVKAVLGKMNFKEGLEIHHDGDLPARSGLGSSSAFVVGLLHALYGLRGQLRSKAQLANEAIEIEQHILKENVGVQDQTLVAHGGLNVLYFRKNGSIEVCPITLPEQRIQELRSFLLLFYTRVSRISSDVAGTYAQNIKAKSAQLNTYVPRLEEANALLHSHEPLDNFGQLLHESWLQKKSLSSEVSTSKIDNLYKLAREAGATGGKVIGAGGGGFLLLFAPPKYHAPIRARLSHLQEVPFRFEDRGSQIIFYDHQSIRAKYSPL